MTNKVLEMFLTLGKVVNEIPSSSNGNPTTLGIGLMQHIKSGMCYVYVGSNLYQYTLNHKHHLNNNTHANDRLQDAFNENNLLHYYYIVTKTKTEAYKIKQVILNEFIDSGLLFNVVRNSGEFRLPIKVKINGVIYNSLGEAKKELNLLKGLIVYRARSTNPKYSDWNIVN